MAEKCRFCPWWPWPLTFDLDLQTRPSQGPNTSSVWSWPKSVQRFPRYFIHKQKPTDWRRQKQNPPQFTACGYKCAASDSFRITLGLYNYYYYYDDDDDDDCYYYYHTQWLKYKFGGPGTLKKNLGPYCQAKGPLSTCSYHQRLCGAWERSPAIFRGPGTAFPRVPPYFNHWTSWSSQQCYLHHLRNTWAL